MKNYRYLMGDMRAVVDSFPGATAKVIREHTHRESISAQRSALRALEEAGMIERRQEGPSNHYHWYITQVGLDAMAKDVKHIEHTVSWWQRSLERSRAALKKAEDCYARAD